MNTQVIATILVATGALLLLGIGIVSFVLWLWKRRNVRNHHAQAQPNATARQVPWSENQEKVQELNDLEHQLRVANLRNRLINGDWYRDVVWPLNAVIQAMRDAGHEPTNDEVDMILERLLSEANQGKKASSKNESPSGLFDSILDAAERQLQVKATIDEDTRDEGVPPWEQR